MSNATDATVGWPRVDSVWVDADDPAILISGATGEAAPTVARLIGSRQELLGEVITNGSRWSARIPLLQSRWKGRPLPPRSGHYVLEGMVVDGTVPAPQLFEAVTRATFATVPGPHATPRLSIEFSAPLTDRERGPAQQAALESDYRAAHYEPLNAVFFESFYGRNASCNPLAIDRVIARDRPDIARYWSVADASVEVPEGAIRIIDGSAEWWRIRGSARLLVINDWMRKRWKKRRYQTVLQTWHGTMLKKLALSRSRIGLRTALASIRESRRWDILLAQNDYSRRIFRRAYAYLGPVWQEGYPRDDVLASGNAAAVRERLGIPADARVILYAPTWRDDNPDHVDHLDVARFADELGPNYVTLIRGHSRTLLPGEDVHAPGVIDVTGYPDISELFLVADALVTDYSSVMFDFSVTGKPIFFFAPDLDDYRERLRGFYFDLLPVAPGPVVQTLDELVACVRSADEIAPDYAAAYADWQARFNPRDDGRAAERVVIRLLAEGYLG